MHKALKADTSACQPSSDLGPARIFPVVSWICRRPSESPKTNAFRVDLREVSNTTDKPNRVRLKARFAVHEVLNRVIAAITDKWFGVYDKPWLPFGFEHIAGVKVRN